MMELTYCTTKRDLVKELKKGIVKWEADSSTFVKDGERLFTVDVKLIVNGSLICNNLEGLGVRIKTVSRHLHRFIHGHPNLKLQGTYWGEENDKVDGRAVILSEYDVPEHPLIESVTIAYLKNVPQGFKIKLLKLNASVKGTDPFLE